MTPSRFEACVRCFALASALTLSAAGVRAQPPGCDVVLHQTDFESGLGGWTIDNSGFGGGNGLWHLSSACESLLPGHSSSTALGYAINGACDYDTAPVPRNSGQAISPPIDLTGVSTPVTLQLNYFVETEQGAPFSPVDVCHLDVSTDNFATFTTIAGNDSGDLIDASGAWRALTADLTPFTGSSIRLRATFDSADGVLNQFAGFYIDDVVVCSYSALSNDNCAGALVVGPGVHYGNTTLATTDGASSCGGSGDKDVWYLYSPTTSHAAEISLCGSSFDTILSVHSACPGTTSTELACDDDACGQQSSLILNVTGGSSYWIRVAGKAGASGLFKLRISEVTLPLDCEDLILYEDFEGGLDGWTIDNNLFGGGGGLWHLTSDCRAANSGHSLPTALAYVLDAGCDYDTGGRNAGQVISPPIDLTSPLIGQAHFQMRYYMDVEQAVLFQDYDVANVDVSTDGFNTFTTVATNFDDLLDPTSYAWVAMTADLSAFVGSVIQIRFTFDTIDSLVNQLGGWYIDDIVVCTSRSPANDDCSGLPLIGPGVYGGDTTYATTNGSSTCDPSSGKDVYFVYPPRRTPERSSPSADPPSTRFSPSPIRARPRRPISSHATTTACHAGRNPS